MMPGLNLPVGLFYLSLASGKPIAACMSYGF